MQKQVVPRILERYRAGRGLAGTTPKRRRAGRRAVRRALVCSLSAAAVPALPQVPDALWDPIPAGIGKGNIVVAATSFVRAPDSSAGETSATTANVRARIQYLQPVPGGSRLAFNDIRGILYLTDTNGTAPVAYLDLREQNVGFYAAGNPLESGFMGFAFHPDFVQNGRPGYGKFYTAHSATVDSGVADYLDRFRGHESVIREWTATDPAASTFAGTSREVFRVGQLGSSHNIGTLAFNPAAAAGSTDSGALYVALGDGGSSNDPLGHGQRRSTPLGSILRIDPLGGGADSSYGIPSDNPFVGTSGALDEIWAYGLRHPQHFSFDSTGRMFINDIGQRSIEEVNLGVAGANYGWRLREGTFATAMGVGASDKRTVYPLPADDTGYTYPIAQYDHDEGDAIGAGFVYEGQAIPSLRNHYVFTDLVKGRLFAFDASSPTPGTPATIEEIRIRFDGQEQERDLLAVAGYDTAPPSGLRVDARLGVDAGGELYLLTKGDGWIRRLDAAPPVTVSADAALTAAFENTPASHDGATAFNVDLWFSEEVDLSYRAFTSGLLTVTGGTVGRAIRLSPPSNAAWRIRMTPARDGEVVIVLPADRTCDRLTGPCTPNGRRLSAAAIVTVPGPPSAPRITSASSFAVPENTTAVATLAAADEDTAQADLAWSVVGGADSAAFALTAGGVLAFAAGKDYENADDADRDGGYEVTVRVSDGSLSATATLVVTLENRNEAPAADAGPDQPDVAQGATVTLSGSATDPDAGDTLSYAWSRTSGPEVVLAGASTATASFTAPAGLVQDARFTFALRATDALGLHGEDTVAVTVTDPVAGPSVSGTPQVGNLLEAVVDASVSPDGYQWLRGGEPVPGANGSSYLLSAADARATVSVRVNARGRWRASAPSPMVWPEPDSPPLAEDEEELLATTMILGTYDRSSYEVYGYSRLTGREFGTLADTSFAADGREVSLFALNEHGLFGLATSPEIAAAEGLTVYWNRHAIRPLKSARGIGGATLWTATTTQPPEEYGRYAGGASDGVRVAVSLRRPLPAATVSVETERVPEGSPVAFLVELDRPAWSALDVSLSVRDEASVLAEAPPAIARFDTGASSTTVTLPTTDDAVVTGDASVEVALAAGAGYVLAETVAAAARVEDDDVATFALSVTPAELGEGDSAAVTLAIGNGVTFAETQSIGLSASGSATGTDYELAPRTLVLAAGAAAVRATLRALIDPYAEGSETVTVTATHGGTAVGSATATIRANEASPDPIATLSANAAAVTEGAPLPFTVALDPAPWTALSVAVSVADPLDALSGPLPSSVAFAQGQRLASLSLPTRDDAVVDAPATVTVTLGAGTGYVLGSAGRAEAMVEDNDVATFTMSAAPAEIAEGDHATLTVSITNGVTFAQAQSIALATTGTAGPEDYELPASMTLGVGAGAAAAALVALDDRDEEPRETVTVTASHGGIAAGSVTLAIRAGDILSDDAALAWLELTGVDFGAFQPDTLDYAGAVTNDVETTTVSASANHQAAGVEIADRSGSTLDGMRTVTLDEGANEVTVTVTAEDARTQRTYTATVARAPPHAWGDRVPERDLVLGPRPSGIWSDGEVLWAIADWRSGSVWAYRLADGARLPSRDVRLSEHGSFPAGLWSDGSTMWVGDWSAWKVFAYRLSDKARQPELEFDLTWKRVPVNPFGMWADGHTVLAADNLRRRVLGFRMSGGAAREGIVVNTTGAGNPGGIWSDGRLLWVVDERDRRAHAYAVPGLGESRGGQMLRIGAVSYAARVPAAASGGRAVWFADPAVHARVAAALGRPSDAVIGELELAALTSLDARASGVTSLSGLEYAISLVALDLGTNAVVDLRPLMALPALEVLNLDGTTADLQPLGALTGLRRLSLRDAGVVDVGFLSGLQALEVLDLRQNRVVETEALNALPVLRVLQLDALPAGPGTSQAPRVLTQDPNDR